MSIFIRVSDAVASEKDGYIEFVVRLSEASTSQVSVSFNTSEGTAHSNDELLNDFEAYSGTLIFAPGTTSQTVRVPLIDDTSAEGLETFQLTFSKAVNASLTATYASGIIADNDTVATTLHKGNLTVRDVIVDESAGTASFLVLLDKTASNDFSVAYSTVDGSAKGGSDYSSSTGSVTFSAGEVEKIITVNINDDTESELEEMFSLKLGTVSGTGASLVQVASGTGQAMIARNDLAIATTPVIKISDALSVRAVDLSM